MHNTGRGSYDYQSLFTETRPCDLIGEVPESFLPNPSVGLAFFYLSTNDRQRLPFRNAIFLERDLFLVPSEKELAWFR